MRNPFASLGRQSLIDIAVPYTEPAQTRVPDSPWMKVAESYDEMVISVLQQLLEAAYPSYSLRNHRAKNKHRHYSPLDSTPAWSIGFYTIDHFSETGRSQPETRWQDAVAVTLIVNTDNHPVGLECSRGARTLRCGLFKTDLIRTLGALH